MFSGMMMSFFEIVIPAWVAKWKPRSLIASSTAAMVVAPYSSTSAVTKSFISFLPSVTLMNGTLPSKSRIESALDCARDLLVEDHAAGRREDDSPFRRYSIGS